MDVQVRHYYSLRDNCGEREVDGDFSCVDPCEAQKMAEDEDHISLEGLDMRGGRKLMHTS